MSEPPEAGPLNAEGDAANPYLQPMPTAWTRVAGVVLLLAAVGVTALLGYALAPRLLHPGAVAPFTSSTLIFLLMLVVVWGFSLQAGWRLLFRRAGEPGALFSWPVWLALGVVLLTLTAIAAGLTLEHGAPTGRELYVLVSMGTIGAWCLWLAWRRRAD